MVDFIGPLKFLCNGEFAVALSGVLSGFSIAICPYKDATQSGVVQTALALKVPVILTNVGALPEMVKDGEYGSIVPPCDSELLAKDIVKMIKKTEILENMKKNITEKWLPSMSWSPIAQNYISIYEE